MSSLKKSKKRQVVSSKLAVKPKKSAKKTKTKNTEPEVTFKAGKPVEATADINCLACMNWSKCPSKKKGRKHACTRLKLYPVKSSSVAAKKINVNLGAVDKDAGLNKEERVISAMISRTLKGSGVIAADTRIDDGDIPTCPNFFTWLTEPKYMGTLQVPWAKQLEHPTKLLSEWCPNPKCTDTKWWDNVPVDATPGDIAERVTFLEHGFCPICKTRKSEWIKQGLLNPYNALAGLAGQRSAKTATAVMIVGYNLHRLLKSQNPSTMYGVMSSQMLTATFAALTFDQAKDNIWSSVYNMLTDAAWFQSYHELLRDQCHRLGIEDVHSITNTYARYRHRNLLYHVSGPNKRTMRGKTRVEAMIDEIGWFLQQLKGKAGSDPERLDAKGTHEALDRSLLTVRAAAERLLLTGINENVPMGYLYETSSPSSKNDMIMQRYESSRGSRTIYGYRMATWEANPTIPRHSSIIVEAYRDDPITAQRDYAAIPPVSGSPFVKLPSLKNLFSNKRENGGMLKTVRVTNHAGQAQTSGRIKKLRAHRGEPSLLALDAGSVNNSFAFAVLYTNPNNGRVIVPFLGEVFPSHEAPIHFPDIIDNVVDRLIEHYNVQVLMADRWQSALLLQEAGEKHEIGAFTRSVKYPDFDMFRQSGIYDGVLQLPMLENKPKDAIKMANAGSGYPGVFANQPISHLLYQLVAVNDIPNVSVTKPDGGTDDLFRALALGYSSIMDPEYAEFFMEQPGGIKQAVGTMVGGLGFGSAANVSNSIGVAVGPGSGGGGSMASMGVVVGRP